MYPTRGLRQGNPISSYLFILCVKCLLAILNDLKNNDMIHGSEIAREAPIITHIFFVDDNYLFFGANREKCHLIRDNLIEYEKASI